MEAVMDKIPKSLHENLSKNLIDIVLSADNRNAVPSELAKRVIYLWRQEQLASPTGIQTLLEAAALTDTNATCNCLEELGIKEVALLLKSVH
jgi:hypothetical protein